MATGTGGTETFLVTVIGAERQPPGQLAGVAAGVADEVAGAGLAEELAGAGEDGLAGVVAVPQAVTPARTAASGASR
ncbi:MAG: hypothetical protein ACYCVZ_05795 [Streptosporangiaceae bacterium]